MTTTQTQTTEERILTILRDHLEFYAGSGEWAAATEAAATIAAEIDRLTADNAQANQWLVNGVAKIAGLEAQLAEARAEAREQIAALEASNAEQAQMMADGFADAKEQSAQLAEARAEVERLRPAAEAWEAYDDYWQTCVASGEIQSIGVHWPSFAEVSEKRHKAEAAAARAREARK